MTDMTSKNRFIQYELWHDCKNNCMFCHNKGSGDIDKKDSMKFVLERLDDEEELSQFNELGIIGGELFDDQLSDMSVKSMFYGQLIAKVKKLLEEGKMQKFYVATALMFKDKTLLEEFCQKLTELGIASKTLICTSYDLSGRFQTEEQHQNWKDNMLWLKDIFPQLKTHVETILSGKFIHAVLAGEFDIKKFQEEYGTAIDYISPHIIDYTHDKSWMKTKAAYNTYIANFFPKRADFMRFMQKTIVEDKTVHAFKFLSNYIRADLVYTIMKGKHVKIHGRRHGDGVFNGADKTMGLTYIDGYADSDIRMETDADMMRETLA